MLWLVPTVEKDSYSCLYRCITFTRRNSKKKHYIQEYISIHSGEKVLECLDGLWYSRRFETSQMYLLFSSIASGLHQVNQSKWCDYNLSQFMALFCFGISNISTSMTLSFSIVLILFTQNSLDLRMIYIWSL